MDSIKVERVASARITHTPGVNSELVHSPAPAPPHVPVAANAEPQAAPPLAAPAARSTVTTKPTRRAAVIARAVLSHSAVAIVTAALFGLAVISSREPHDGSSAPGRPDILLAQAAPASAASRPAALVAPVTTPVPSDSERLQNVVSAGCPELRGSFRLSVRIEEQQARLLRVNSTPLNVESHPEHACLEKNLASVRFADSATGIKLFVVKL